jgi:hypothetical protein
MRKNNARLLTRNLPLRNLYAFAVHVSMIRRGAYIQKDALEVTRAFELIQLSEGPSSYVDVMDVFGKWPVAAEPHLVL